MAGYGAAALVIALLAGLAWYSMAKSLDGLAHERHSTHILNTVEKIDSSMALAIAAHRGYLLWGNARLREQRDTAVNMLDASVAQTGELTRDNPAQQLLLVQVRKILAERKTLFLMAEQDAEMVKGNGPSNTSTLRGVLSQMTYTEQQRLAMYHEEQTMRQRWAERSAALLLVFLTLFLLTIYLLINRNLRRDETRVALEKKEALLRQILDLLPVGVFVVDYSGKFTIINPAARRIWGTAADGSQDHQYAYPAWHRNSNDKVSFEQYGLVRAFRDGAVALNEPFTIETADGKQKFVRSSAMPLRDHMGGITGAIAVNMDVTDLKQTQSALKATHDALEARVAMRTRELVIANSQLHAEVEERRRAEQALRHMQNVLTSAQRVGQVGSWEINLRTREEQWSDEFFRICGLQPGSARPGLPLWLDMVHPDDRDVVATAVASTLVGGKESRLVMRIIRPDGTIRHVLAQAERINSFDGTPIAMIASLHDITEQKQNEDLLRQLALHQERIKEDERKRIAREIHDEMGQNLLALRIDVSMLHARTAALHPRLHRKVDTVMQNIDNTIKSVRAIINNLRPAVLDLGLHAAIQWQVAEFQRRSMLRCTLHADIDDLGQALDEEQTTTLFRVLQESLTNVARHANACSVDIRLYREAGQLCMRIADDGVGIYLNERRKPHSFGLVGIRERISAIGGDLEIDSIPGRGTVLLLTIPLTEEVPMLQQAEIDF